MCMALIGAACGDEAADQSCIRHSNCAMGWYCSQGVCRSKPPTVVRVDAGVPADSGPIDSGRTDATTDASLADASLADVLFDASLSDAAMLTDVHTDASVEAGSTGDASVLPDVQTAVDATVSDAQAAVDAAQTQDAASVEAGGVVSDASHEAGPQDASAGSPDIDQVPDSGPLDVPTPDLAPDAGITDRGFGSFPLPSFDMGFGKPR